MQRRRMTAALSVATALALLGAGLPATGAAAGPSTVAPAAATHADTNTETNTDTDAGDALALLGVPAPQTLRAGADRTGAQDEAPAQPEAQAQAHVEAHVEAHIGTTRLTSAATPRTPVAPAISATPAMGTGTAPRLVGRVPGTALPAFRIAAQAPRRVAAAQRPYASAGINYDRAVFDATGVAMYSRGGRLYNHPVIQSNHVLAAAAQYRLTRKPADLATAVRHGERLLTTAVRSRGALYLPYRFDFPLHGRTGLTLKSPWYSAMAQGEALSSFVALAELTGQRRWRLAADATFASFLNPRSAKAPWTVEVDNRGLLWFEEYAGSHTDRAYNGHNFAVFGVYDYWWLTGNARAWTVFRGGLEASRQRYAQIRVAGRTSRYCLAHDVHSESYHGVHIVQLLALYRLTGSRDFARAADQLQTDSPREYLGGVGYLGAGRHTLVSRGTDGGVRATRTLTLPAARQVTVGKRWWVAGRPGAWMRVDSGAAKGWWVAELPGRSFVGGVRDSLRYTPARPGVLAAGTRTGYTMVGGRWTGTTVRVARRTGVQVGERFLRDGQVYLTMTTGPLAGRAVPAAAVALT